MVVVVLFVLMHFCMHVVYCTVCMYIGFRHDERKSYSLYIYQYSTITLVSLPILCIFIYLSHTGWGRFSHTFCEMSFKLALILYCLNMMRY